MVLKISNIVKLNIALHATPVLLAMLKMRPKILLGHVHQCAQVGSVLRLHS